jgi:outer membrane protein OmpA-like peptidoglycan-associated protein
MKKIALTILVAFLLGINCNAASDNDTTRYLASTMKQNWFITANASINWWQGSDRIPAGNFTTLNGPSFGGEVSFGKWITHNIGLRLAYDVNPGKSFINGLHVKEQDALGFLFGDNPTPYQTVIQDQVENDAVQTISWDYYQTSFIYHNIHVDVVISPRDLIEGYYFKRLYNPLILAGMGFGAVSAQPLLVQSIFKPKNGESINFELSYDVGLMNCFRINDYLDIDLTFMLQGQRFTIDSWGNEFNYIVPTPDGGTKAVRPKRADHNYKASLGLVWYPAGRIYETPYNYVKEMKELRERLKQCEEALDNTVEVPVAVPVHDTTFIVTPGEFISYPFSIFFHLDSYELMSGRDIVNLREIAEVAMAHGCKFKLRGSCDSATATSEYNQRLSENRCNKIKDELMKLGVPESQITFDAIGGIKELSPTKYDRRVIITLIKE